MRCPTCDTPCADDTNFCATCGTALRNVVPLHGAVRASDAASGVEDSPAQGPVAVDGSSSPAGTPYAGPAPPPPAAPHSATQGTSDDERTTSRTVAGTILALATVISFAVAIGVFAAGYAALSGLFVFLAATAMIAMRTLPRSEQSAVGAAMYEGWAQRVDGLLQRVTRYGDLKLKLRRERDRYAVMRAERTRRALALGEAAYRLHRAGELDERLIAHAQRITSIEQHLLVQDQRLEDLSHQLRAQPRKRRRRRSGTKE